MDRKSSNIGLRAAKKLSTHAGSEFFALGSKSCRDENKGKLVPISKGVGVGVSGVGGSSGVGIGGAGGVGTSSLDRKREASTSSSANSLIVAKKAKLAVAGTSLRTQADSVSGISSGPTYELWEQMTTDCESIDLVETVLTAGEQNDTEAIVRLICGCIKTLLLSACKSKPLDTVSYLSILYLAKIHPDYLTSDIITSGLLQILRRDFNAKSRQSPQMHILAANLLMRSFHDKSKWPEIFLRIYVEDAINERYWSDNTLCAPFIENIAAAFRTRSPQLNFSQNDSSTGAVISSTNTPTVSTCASSVVAAAAAAAAGVSSTSATSSAGTTTSLAGTVALTVPQTPSGVTPINLDDDSCDNSEASGSVRPATELKQKDVLWEIKNRYSDNEQIVEKYVTDAIKEQLNRRQQQDCYTRNFLKFLCKTSGLMEVRNLCISRLELWIHNGKLVKFAQELLSHICFNVRSKHHKDHEVLAILVKMRLKAKPLINFYMTCIKEMIHLEPGILSVMLKLVVQNELSNSRNPNNMGMLATMFQTAPDDSATHLAEIYKEFLLQRDDCLRTLRVFLRELVRMLRNDINLMMFCKVFLNCRPDLNRQIENCEYRERIFHSIVDIVCLCMLLSGSPQVREASISLRVNNQNNPSSLSNPHNQNNVIVLKFYQQMCQIQLEAVTWMYETVTSLFKLQAVEFSQGLHKLLLLENPEQYSRCDQWPSEPERTALLRLVAESPIHEETLIRIILIGITKDIPFNIPETFDIIILLLKRPSSLRNSNCPLVQANKYDIIDFLFSMSEYHHPENIKIPADYEAPKLAITVLYWKAWLILLMISAHNPSTFGAFCWSHYPTIKLLMEMCITNQFNEIPMSKEELQVSTLERDTIVEFETHLAAQTSKTVITEETAILISQLMLMDPMGVARRPPNVVIEQLKYLNKTLKLGHLLCRSRKPDLLLDIIQRQGTTLSMPWLSDLVQNSEGEFNHLPVQCLCEFLLFNSSIINEENSRHAELVNFLRHVILEANYSKETVCEILDYIFRRLCSVVKQSRLSALRGLKIIFNCCDTSSSSTTNTTTTTTTTTNNNNNNWLLSAIPQIPHFNEVKVFIIPQLRSACQVENSPDLIMAYIQFIAAHTLDDSVTDMLDHVIDMSQLIVERSTMFQHIIPITPEPNSTTLDVEEVEQEQKSEQEQEQQQNRLQTLKCLFVMFNNYIIKLREHCETYQWPEYPDLLMVQFSDGIQLPLHLNIIHAFIILLTHSDNDMPESVPILDYWFPLDGQIPVAFIPNIPEEPVQYLPDWLKLKMIRSPVERLIDAAVRELTPDQLVLFVQNFGTPINSMSKLLALLDHAVNAQLDLVKNAILNKAYLAQLIEIQQIRGAKNGHFTVQALGLHSHSQTVDDNPKIPTKVLETINLDDLIPIMENVRNDGKQSTNDNSENMMTVDEMIPNTRGGLLDENETTKDQQFHQIINQLRTASTTDVLANFQKIDIKHLIIDVWEYKEIITLLHLVDKLHPELLDGGDEENDDLMLWATQAIKEAKSPNTDLYLDTLKHMKRNHLKYSHSQPIKSEEPVQSADKRLKQLIDDFNREMTQPKASESSSSSMKISVTTAPDDSQDEYIGPLIATSTNKWSLYNHGMLVDLISQIDPELMTMSTRNNLNYLFSTECGEFRFYLLSWLCHEANWQTIIHILDYLLLHSMHHSTTNDKRNMNNKFDFTTALNFIQALINNPKLWQGRDRSILQLESNEDILNLTDSELQGLTEFILNEGENKLQTSESQYTFELCCRINLLFRLTQKQIRQLMKFIEYVFKLNCSAKLRFKVLRQMYVMYPAIKFLRSHYMEEENIVELQNLNGCQADKVCNNLITCLGNLCTKKDFDAFSSDTELLIRKLAASHPALFLRQFGVLSSLIQGRGKLSLRTIRDEYHMHRFIQILRILELLQPICYDDIYKMDIQNAFTCYFTFFQQYGYARETYHILVKFVDLLQGYINANPNSALEFMEQYVDILMNLSQRFNSIGSLHQLVQGIALLQHKTNSSSDLSTDNDRQEYDLEEASTELVKSSSSSSVTAAAVSSSAAASASTSAAASTSASAPTPMDCDPNGQLMELSTNYQLANVDNFNSNRSAAAFAATKTTTFSVNSTNLNNISPHFANLIKIVINSSAEDVILAPLQEIECMTSKRFAFLHELFERLLELIFSPSAQIRFNAFILLIRHLKHNPGRKDVNRCALNAYIQCLRDDNPSVAATAIDNLPEMTILLQEHAIEILSVSFTLGIKSRLNTNYQIRKVLQTIMLQHGY